jgi:hypothetical protein
MRISGAVLLLAVLFAGLLFLPSVVWAQQTDAASDISAAQTKLVQSFDAAQAAGSAGANISQLTSTLNRASLLLSHAELAYSTGDFEAAQSFAVQSQNVLINFVLNANSLSAAATQSHNRDFLYNVVAPVVGTVAVLVGGVLVWVLLKRKYGKRGV